MHTPTLSVRSKRLAQSRCRKYTLEFTWAKAHRGRTHSCSTLLDYVTSYVNYASKPYAYPYRTIALSGRDHEVTPPDMTEFDALIALSADVGSNIDLVQGAGGNTSLKEGNDLWIKASGAWLADAR